MRPLVGAASGPNAPAGGEARWGEAVAPVLHLPWQAPVRGPQAQPTGSATRSLPDGCNLARRPRLTADSISQTEAA